MTQDTLDGFSDKEIFEKYGIDIRDHEEPKRKIVSTDSSVDKDYGFLIAARKAVAKSEKSRAVASKPRKKLTAAEKKAKKSPDLKLYPLDSDKKHKPYDWIEWGENVSVSIDVADRFDHDNKFQILNVPTGVGKTVLATRAVGILQERAGRDLPVIIVASSNIISKGGWQSTIKSWNLANPDNLINPVMIESFDRFANILDHPSTLKETIKLLGKDGVLILDEVHNYKNPMSKRAKTMRRLCQYRKLGLTATPLTNDVILDGCSYLMLNGLFSSKRAFMREYNLENKLGFYGEFLVYDKRNTISTRLWPEYTRFSDDLSRIIYRPVIDMSDITMPNVTSHVEMLEYDREFDMKYDSLKKAMKARAFDSATDYVIALIEEIGRSRVRMDRLVELVKNPEHYQPIVFYWNVAVMEAIIERFNEEGIEYQLINGEHAAGDVDTSRSCPIIVQYQSGAEGIEMPDSNVSIFYQNQNSASKLEQARGRNVRRGHDHHVDHYYLITPCHFDEVVFERLTNRLETSNKVLAEIALEDL